MKLLVVEDDVKIAAALRRGLTAEGFQVEIADDGLDGLWRAREGAYDLIVLDIMLPGRNGYRVCADLRAAGDTTPDPRAHREGRRVDEAEGLDTGADDYLRKPFSVPVLVSRVHALLRRAALGEPPPLTAGDVVLDLRARRVHRGDVEVRAHRARVRPAGPPGRRAGQVVPSGRSWTGSGTTTSTGDPNVVEVYVARLRRKLDEPSGACPIETVRGAGYRIPRQ